MTGNDDVSVGVFIDVVPRRERFSSSIVTVLFVDGGLTPEEQTFVETTSAAGASANLEYITSFDHVAGTPGDYQSAVFVQNTFQQFGLQAEIVTFQTLINYPINRSLELISGDGYVAGLSEDIVPDDPTSDNRWRNLTFHGYGASGDVVGSLIYVNYGSYEDFEYVLSQGIDVTGSIVIARYGQVFRGLKVQNAQDFGAIGCIIYSDPADDGYTQGPVYPDGPWRPESGVQRGSVQFLSRCSGDPGFIERDPQACGYDTDELIPRIPSIPISYRDAQPLLAQLTGVKPPTSWLGGLPVPYGINGTAEVHLTVSMNYTIGELYNVVATIPGTDPNQEMANQQIILGNHRDAWVFGSTDPNSGTVALLEIARGIGALLESGWRPARTIKLISWDGEEYGLLGSTNYVERNYQDLQDNALVYLNVDVAVTGSQLYVSATPSLSQFAIDTSSDIIDPNTNKTLQEVWNPTASINNVGVLGSGSDFAGFLHHTGVASLDMGFNGPYVYDSYTWTSKFGDPTFVYHRCMAQYWGLLALRLSSARVLPFRFGDYAAQLLSYNTQIQSRAANVSGTLDFSSLTNAINEFQSPAAVVECYRSYVENNSSVSEEELASLNVGLATMERAWIIVSGDGFEGDGLPSRIWYKHPIQAPGLDTGYDANVFPSIWDALDRSNVTAAQEQIGLVAEKIARATDILAMIAPYVPAGCTY